MVDQFIEGNFLGLPDVDGDADVIIAPIPYELTTSYGQGTAEGPAACIAASGQVELFDHKLGQELPAGKKIRTVQPWSGEGNTLQEQLNGIGEYAAEQYNSGAFPIFLGGEHGILPGILRGCPKKVTFNMLLVPRCIRSFTSSRQTLCLEIVFWSFLTKI